MAGFEDLSVWKTARTLCGEIYRISDEGAFRRDWALKDQIRRAIVSVPSNTAEGLQRKYRKDFGRFLTIALGSLGEVRTQLYLALDRGYLHQSDADRLQGDLRGLAAGLEALRATVLRQ